MTKQQRNLLKLALVGLVGAGVGFGLGKFSTYFLPKELLRNLFASPAGVGEVATKIILALVALWAALAAHELGHLLTGLAQGFRFHLYVAGYLGVRRNPQTDNIEGYFNRDAQLFGGVAATVPTQRTMDLRQRFAWVVLAGPLTSLLTGGLALGLLYINLSSPALVHSVWLRCGLTFAFAFGLTSLALFLATTLPTRTGVFFTDRARFFRLIRGGHDARVEQAILETMAHTMSGQPYSELDNQQLDLLLNEPQAFFRSYAHTLAYYRHLDRDELVEAYVHIQSADALTDGQPQLFKREIWKELAFAHAFIGRDPALARQVWQQITPSPDLKPTGHSFLVKAAIALAEKELTLSVSHAQTGLGLLPSRLVKPDEKLYARLLQQLAQSLKQAA